MERFSYSKLDTFDQCPMRYKFTYIDELRSEESTLALDLGTTAHKGKELWGEYLINGEEPDLEFILDVLNNGREYWKIDIINGVKITDELEENILGLNEIKRKYFEEYCERCNKSGLTYDQKFKIYLHSLQDRQLSDGWRILAVEREFNIIYNDRCILHGFIDRIDINENGDIRVIDYKTSKDTYRDDKLATPLQMFIYALACEKILGKLPTEFIYDFIFLGKKQYACTKGYYNRGVRKLDKLLNNIEECINKDEFIPKPSPLCYWCPFSGNTCAIDRKLNGLCEYYSLWTPKNKTYNVNKKWGEKLISDEKIVAKKQFIW